MKTSDLDYHLPSSLIATEPASPRDSARLMVIHRHSGQVADHHVRDLPALGILQPNDLLIFNQSKVIPAYFELTRTATDGHVTGLYLGEEAGQAAMWSVMLESRGKLREGEWLHFDERSRLELVTRFEGGRWLAKLHSPLSSLQLLDEVGSPPLPPYIRKQRQTLALPALAQADRQRYNTVYATQPGSVAAPTAGLHFTPELLEKLDELGIARAMVTLHVGLGTFAPIRTENVEDHPIHSEFCSVPSQTLAAIAKARQAGGRILPVGTTTVRTLESLPQPVPDASQGDYQMNTNLFITPASETSPGFTFHQTDMLMTNFHLPRSSLLALVAALPDVGVDRLMQWYARAIDRQYRFYSYGDAMLIV